MRSDVVVVGAGIGGLTAALKLSRMKVTVLSKSPLGSGVATDWAQGGIAAAIGADDSPTLHKIDTQRAGAGLSDEAVVEILTRDAPARIEELLQLGAAFDRTETGSLALGREAAHNRRRIVRAGGDATGHEILKALISAVRLAPHINIIEDVIADELIAAEGRVDGVVGHRADTGEMFELRADATILATGGIGRLYRYTTNPAQSTGDGIAMAARAGAILADMEFVQFHPTALAIARDPLPLVTEAIRGEGAVLRNNLGERFLLALHDAAELAPRDVVARGIDFQQRAGRTVSLDATEAIGDEFPQRFPTVFTACMSAGIDPRISAIPVTPAAHYHMGGIAVDAWGRSSLQSLWACGETSATGAHGANRLASNSLMEALVYATRVAQDIASTEKPPLRRTSAKSKTVVLPAAIPEHEAIAALRTLMYANAGVVRSSVTLSAALARLSDLELANQPTNTGNLHNLLTVGRLVIEAALDRKESRGSHYRSDFPHQVEALAKRTFRTLQGAA